MSIIMIVSDALTQFLPAVGQYVYIFVVDPNLVYIHCHSVALLFLFAEKLFNYYCINNVCVLYLLCDADIISKMCIGGAVFNGSVSVTQSLYTGGKVTKAYRMAQLSEQMSRKQYEAGMESIGDLLEVQTLWQQAYATMVENRCAKYLAHVKYLKAAGLLAVSD